MGKKNIRGSFVLVVIAVFLIFIINIVSGIFAERKIHYSVRFTNIGTLYKGATVKQAGMNIGEVTNISSTVIMEPTPTHYVVVDVSVSENAQVSYDSTASIYILGMMGEQYIDLSIGTLEKAPDGTKLIGHGPQQMDKVIEQSAQALSND